MGSELLSDGSWRALVLLILVVAGIAGGFVFFLRQNREDLRSLEQTMEESERNDEAP